MSLAPLSLLTPGNAFRCIFSIIPPLLPRGPGSVPVPSTQTGFLLSQLLNAWSETFILNQAMLPLPSVSWGCRMCPYLPSAKCLRGLGRVLISRDTLRSDAGQSGAA